MTIQNFNNQFSQLKNPINGVRLPQISIDPKRFKSLKLKEDSSNFDFLRAICKEGFQNLKLPKDSPEYKQYGERIKYELDIFQELSLVDYILIVWDVINYCKDNNIAVGPGRGSACGSMVLYLIGVTKIDPLKHDLFFERFISKIRAKKTIIDGITYFSGDLLPDIDTDFSYYDRNKVIEYINNKYNKKTCKILTLNTLSSKLLIKEVGKVLGMKEEEEMTQVTGFIPKLHGIVYDFDKAYKESIDFKEWCDKNPLVYQTCIKLKDLIKNSGVHPSGLLISYNNLEDCCPTQLSSDKEIISSYDMNYVASFAIKLDALGLRSVSVIDDCCKSIGIKSEDIDVHHHSIYNALQNLHSPHGIFQLETQFAYQTTQKVKPKNFNELSAILALARPGAMQFIDQFAKFSNEGEFQSIHPFFDEILKETGFLCLYQEQLMKCLNKIGFSLDESETARKIVGKKLKEKVIEWEQKIKDKVKENKLDPKIADIIWEILNKSASYSFNKSHSVAYATLCAQTIYLKFNYPTQFYISLLRMTQHEPDPIGEISKIHKEMSAFNIELLPPSLTLSDINFTVEGKNIRFGLSSIKGISGKTIEKLNNFERKQSNKFELFESAKEAGLNLGALSAIIQAGCLDNIAQNRVLLTYEAQLFNILKPKEKKYVINYAKNYENNIAKTVKALVETIKDEKSKPIIKLSRFETIKKDSEKYKRIYEKNKICQDLAHWFYSNRLIGFTNGKKLIDIFLTKKSTLRPLNIIKNLDEKTRCDFVGIVDENPKSGKSKNGNAYAKFQISDETSLIKVMIFTNKLDYCKELNNGLPKEGEIVIISGTLMQDDCIFADSIASQQNHIYDSLQDLE